MHKCVTVVALPATIFLCQTRAAALTLPELQAGLFQFFTHLLSPGVISAKQVRT